MLSIISSLFNRAFKTINLSLGNTKRSIGFGFIMNCPMEQTGHMSPITSIHFVILLFFLISMVYFC